MEVEEWGGGIYPPHLSPEDPLPSSAKLGIVAVLLCQPQMSPGLKGMIGSSKSAPQTG